MKCPLNTEKGEVETKRNKYGIAREVLSEYLEAIEKELWPRTENIAIFIQMFSIWLARNERKNNKEEMNEG